MTPFESFAGTRCMDRWDEGGWDSLTGDPYRPGRFTTIVSRVVIAVIERKIIDVLFTIPNSAYSVPDTMTVHHRLALFVRY